MLVGSDQSWPSFWLKRAPDASTVIRRLFSRRAKRWPTIRKRPLCFVRSSVWGWVQREPGSPCALISGMGTPKQKTISRLKQAGVSSYADLGDSTGQPPNNPPPKSAQSHAQERWSHSGKILWSRWEILRRPALSSELGLILLTSQVVRDSSGPCFATRVVQLFAAPSGDRRRAT